MAKKSRDKIAAEVRTELRSIIRQTDDLRRPLSRFEVHRRRRIGEPRFYVSFDVNARRDINGLKTFYPSITLPDERIEDAVTNLAKSVWHLKDRLRQYAKAIGSKEDVEAWANGSQSLLVSADLANYKKHGESRNRSKINPRIEGVRFDTSQSGLAELWYEGATKEKDLLVTLRKPIPYTVDIHIDGGVVLGDAVSLLSSAFQHWLPLIERLGVVANDNRESVSLRERLFKST